MSKFTSRLTSSSGVHSSPKPSSVQIVTPRACAAGAGKAMLGVWPWVCAVGKKINK